MKNEDDLNALPIENEIQNIEKTIHHYFEGTAHSKDDRIKIAFWKDLNLYSVKEGKINVLPGEKYLEYFTKGKNFNRIGKILNIDLEKDAALVKLEIKMPDRNRIAIDYMLLLKINDSWKVIHKSFTDKSF
ncbi:nuclear transport factor 2 family protein [Leptobacterium flavescens]|uniref:Nuclear transport factor 2 family protein n=1 Tax=Leptobacterium flavescens TaxID=472055 RepID=A0A6P0UPY0_9FLAO|nr:nuclear transport factor 2 family protein [Leptobacterium flavescens]